MEEGKKRWRTLVLKTLEGTTKQVASPTIGGGKNCYKSTIVGRECCTIMLKNKRNLQNRKTK